MFHTKTESLHRIKLLILFTFPVIFGFAGCAAKKHMEEQEKVVYQQNKTIPKSILEEAKTALSYYPELKEVAIDFRFKNSIKKSFMQAQPQLGNLFKGKNRREYNIFISDTVKIEEEEFSMQDVPSEVLIGWLGHELGHIMDYREKTAAGLVIFGIRYITSHNYIKEAERAADVYAVNHGMGEYILATKNFILNSSTLSDEYKERISRLYLSPEEIIVLVNKLEEDVEKAKQEHG